MKKIFLFFSVLCLASCHTSKREKPFVIVYKNVTYTKGWAHYEYQDSNGNTFGFSDVPTAYKIGDTIK